MSSESSRKRALDENTMEDGASMKRRLVEDTTFKTRQPQQGAQFQCFHLLLLQSLYDTDESVPDGYLDDDSIGSVTNDGLEIADDTVDDSLWNLTRKFVKERDNLIKFKKESFRVNSVHQEALDYLEEQETTSPTPSTPSSRHGWQQEDGLSRSAGKHRSIASPNSLSFFSQRHGSQTPSVKIHPKGFTLVAQILQEKCKEFKAKNFSAPYAPVREKVEEKIENLEEKLRVLKESNLSKQKRHVEDLLSRALVPSSSGAGGTEAGGDQFDLKSFMSKLETKLNLWRLLAADLKDVVPSKGS